MNALVKKEIRLLLPSFGFACALALPNFAFRFNADGSLVGWWWFLLSYAFCGATAVMLALNSFGVEISSGTFSNLLAQPVARQKIWDTKILLLAVSLSLVGMLWGVCGIIRLEMLGRDLNLLDLFTGVGTFGLVVFSGGLWTVLLLRQVAAAFWFTVLVPGVIWAIVAAFFGDKTDALVEGLVVIVLGVYSLAGFFYARWLFFRAQDVHWSGGSIVLPEVRGLAWLKAAGTLRTWRPRGALWRKEIQLHQSQFVIAFVLVVLHGGVLAVRHIYDLHNSRDLKSALEIFWGIWLVMPLLVGCAAVAEERKLGTHEGQLCLPVKRRTQFAIKFSVALFLSVFLGAIMPLLLEGTRILPDAHFKFHFSSAAGMQMSLAQIFFWNCVIEFNVFLPLLTLLFIAATIGSVAFYVSTLVRNTLQSLAPAVTGIVIIGLLLLAAAVPNRWDYSELADWLWRGPLIYFIGLPVLTLTLLTLAFQNFNHVRTDGKMIWRNLLAVVGAIMFAAVVTAGCYHRVWEKLTPFEPPPGAARLTLSAPARLNTERGDVIVRLPDGKNWMSQFNFTRNDRNPLQLMLGDFKANISPGQLLDGTNWLRVKRAGWEIVGIKTDGTLWVSEQPLTRQLRSGLWSDHPDSLFHLVPFGGDTNWSSFSSYAFYTLLVKTDGTLWCWGTNKFDFERGQWPGLRAFTPRRFGTESNWAEVFESRYQTCFYKTNGTCWATGDWDANNQTQIQIETNFVVHSTPTLARGGFHSTAMISHGLQYRIGVRDDGTFRIWADEQMNNGHVPRGGSYIWRTADLQIGGGTNWLAVAGGWEKVVTLKSDGTLWLWDFHRNHPWSDPWDREHFEPEIQKTAPVRLGTHADWIAISGDSEAVTALAADGSLWYWPLFDTQNYYEGHSELASILPLLDVSRKPQRLGNVFDPQSQLPQHSQMGD